MSAQVRYVYLIQQGNDYKIGSSASPTTRLGQVAPGGRIVHCFASADAYGVERALHQRFRDRRVGGRGREWFRLGEEDVAAVCLLSQTDAPDSLPPSLRPPTPARPRVPVTSFRPPDAMLARLRESAKRSRRSLAQEVIVLLERAIADRPAPDPLRPGA